MDINAVFNFEVQAHCPNAKIVYDLFHFIAKFRREGIDRVNQASKVMYWVKRSLWVLLKIKGNLITRQDSYLT